MKQAAYIGNEHAAARVTPFFDDRAQVMAHCKAHGIDYSFVRGCSNWQEHMAWNTARVGFYATNQIAE
jgi:hypothetical protein